MAPRIITVLLLALGLSTAAHAGAEGDVVIVGDEGQRLVMTVDGGELTVTTEDGEHTSVRVVDMEQMGLLVGDALAGLDDVLATLADMQVDVHMGRDNRLRVAVDDETIEVDVEAIMAQVSAALEAGLGEIDAGDWTHVHRRDREAEDLREELRSLKRELRELRRELRDLEDERP